MNVCYTDRLPESIRDLTSNGLSPDARILGLQALIKLLRFVSVWSMETREPKVNTEVATKAYQLATSMSALLSGQNRTNVMGSAKVVAESLKGIIVGVKSTVPARLGPEVSEDEGRQLLDDALSTVCISIISSATHVPNIHCTSCTATTYHT